MTQFHCITTLENSDNGQPVWIDSQQSLFWVDHANQKLYQYHEPSQEVTECTLDAPILSLSPRVNNGFIATLEDGIGFYDMQTRQVKYISKPEPFSTNKETIAGVTDNYGNYWSFTHQKDASGKPGNLYHLNSKMDMKRVSGDGWNCTAPPAFSKDGSMLYQSSGITRYIYATKLNEQRQPVETYNLCRISKAEGYPHGLCVDNEDFLWVCHRNAGLISRFNKQGDCIEKIKIAAPGVKYCTFGGNNLDQLFIVTSGSQSLKQNRRNIKYADSVISFKPGVTGLHTHRFAG